MLDAELLGSHITAVLPQRARVMHQSRYRYQVLVLLPQFLPHSQSQCAIEWRVHSTSLYPHPRAPLSMSLRAGTYSYTSADLTQTQTCPHARTSASTLPARTSIPATDSHNRGMNASTKLRTNPPLCMPQMQHRRNGPMPTARLMWPALHRLPWPLHFEKISAELSWYRIQFINHDKCTASKVVAVTCNSISKSKNA